MKNLLKKAVIAVVITSVTIGIINSNNVTSDCQKNRFKIKENKDSRLIIKKSYSNILIIKDIKEEGIKEAINVNVQENKNPKADAGEDKTVEVGSTVFLDASNSYDPQGMTLKYNWNILSKPKDSNSSIKDKNQKVSNFLPDVPGKYYISLKVTTSDNRSANDEIVITAELGEKKAPIADAGEDKTVEVGAKVFMDASNSYDPQGKELTYEWFFSAKPKDSKAELINSKEKICTFTPDVHGQFYLYLQVKTTDNRNACDEVIITAEENNNILPIADAGEDKTVEVGSMVYVDASNSYDPIGSELSYKWFISAKPKDSNSFIVNSDQSICNFKTDKEGEYYLTLVVTTKDNRSASDDIIIYAAQEDIVNPIVDITDDLTCCLNSFVYLDGNNSYDPLGKKLNYFWYFNSKPSKSKSVIKNKNNPICSLRLDRVGEYIVTLLVETEDSRKASKSVIITAVVCDFIPLATIEYESTYCICENPLVILNGEKSSSGSDDYIIYYEWQMSKKPENSNAFLLTDGLSSNHFIPDIPGIYKISLIVTTNSGVKSEKVEANIIVYDGTKPNINMEFKTEKIISIIDEKFIIGINLVISNKYERCFYIPFKMIILRSNNGENFSKIKSYIIPSEYETEKYFNFNFIDSYLNNLNQFYMVLIIDELNNILIHDIYEVLK